MLLFFARVRVDVKVPKCLTGGEWQTVQRKTNGKKVKTNQKCRSMETAEQRWNPRLAWNMCWARTHKPQSASNPTNQAEIPMSPALEARWNST